ncbi:hypothetical protein E1262_16815 [Jiangella aurantiaca]|uniref:Uncharacterized protein n=1 Tax=Jiangella aurantiaca TaxID=2530373 RepID=A0A4V2YS48_9ACTN|nr:hypothetical protein [Jiangella aurantiaca]TDD68067.1 hypothetical protein E1262_16815 [Jiangella aurantiaca]
MFNTTRRRRSVVVPMSALLGVLAFSISASAEAERSLFFEETAEAFWAVPHQCVDGSTVQATLLVRSTRDFESPDTEDPDPTARVQYLAVCPDGRSFSWAAPAAPATITSTENLKSVTATGTGIARDNLGGSHQVSFDVAWTGVGELETSVRTTSNQGFSVNTSTRKQREATATGRVTFDGDVLVDGAANHPTRPAPFIRTDEERTTRPPS